MVRKPLGRKNYGSIPHLPSSRTGPSDKSCHEGQARIATAQARDKNDEVFVQEKLDGSNVGVALDGAVLYPLGRAGYPASSSPFKQHVLFHNWVFANYERFIRVLDDGERIVGEWMIQAHGTRYHLPHEPFVAFDLMRGEERIPYDEFMGRVNGVFVVPYLIHRGDPLSVQDAMARLNGYCGFHGAKEPVEGAVWRVERDRATGRRGEKKRVVDFLVKYVRPDKVDGAYLPSEPEAPPVWNVWPGGMDIFKGEQSGSNQKVWRVQAG